MLRHRGSLVVGGLAESAELGPVLGVALGVLADHVAVDGVALDEAAEARRFVGAVEEDAPRGRLRSPHQASCADAWPTGNPTVRVAITSASVWSTFSGHPARKW